MREEQIFPPDVVIDSTEVEANNFSALSLSSLRRKVIGRHNNTNAILAGRKLRYSIYPPLLHDLGRYKKWIVSDIDFDHILIEVNGKNEDYPIPQRPDLELHFVRIESTIMGNESKSQNQDYFDFPDRYESLFSSVFTRIDSIELMSITLPLDKSNINTMQILYDTSKSVYILTKYMEDVLSFISHVYRLTNTSTKYDWKLISALIQLGEQDIYCTDVIKQRTWRRFLQQFIHPLIANDGQIHQLNHRIIEHEQKVIKELNSNPYETDSDTVSIVNPSDDPSEDGSIRIKDQLLKKEPNKNGSRLNSPVHPRPAPGQVSRKETMKMKFQNKFKKLNFKVSTDQSVDDT